jgi:hypothetical protein
VFPIICTILEVVVATSPIRIESVVASQKFDVPVFSDSAVVGVILALMFGTVAKAAVVPNIKLPPKAVLTVGKVDVLAGKSKMD